MPDLQVSILLPYVLRLLDGDYPTSPTGEIVQVRQPPLLEGAIARSTVGARFHHDEVADPNEKERLRARDAEQLLRRTNRLLRWYRAVSDKTEVIELTRTQASPFHCQILGAATAEGWNDPINYEAVGPTALPLGIDELTVAVRQGLSSGGEPLVADLLPIDAERALREGRFRESVLLCWSTIDAVFNRKYDSLVDTALENEWGDARDFFKCADFGLRHKMSAVMHLVANRSLFREPDDLWEVLSKSYKRRNAIIHRGDNATEDEAHSAIELARRIVGLMNSL